MVWGALVSAGAGLLGGLLGSDKESDAINNAAQLQQESMQKAIEEIRRQYGEDSEQMKAFVANIQSQTQPFQQAGVNALEQQQALAGLLGPERQKQAQDAISGGEQFSALAAQGENALLQNASATGGLRGGNTKGALAQFRPQLLQQLLEQQYGRLGGLAGQGMDATRINASLPFQVQRQDLTGLITGQGASQAGAVMGGAQSNIGKYSGIAANLGTLSGLDYSKMFGGGIKPGGNFNPGNPGSFLGRGLDI